MRSDEWRRRIRRYRLLRSRRRHARLRRAVLIGIVALAMLTGMLIAVANGMASSHRAEAAPRAPSSSSTSAYQQCRAVLAWPVDVPKVVRAFDPPERPWQAGHRGIDLAVSTGEGLLAPDDGVIRFSGAVAGKSVVSILHGSTISTFEPAQSALSAGATVRRGEMFAQVGGGSDHCGDSCVHWGVKRGEDEYLDPQQLASSRRIVLKHPAPS